MTTEPAQETPEILWRFDWATPRPADLEPRSYPCGHCGAVAGTNRGFHAIAQRLDERLPAVIYICSNCGEPTYFGPSGDQEPGPLFGNNVQALPADIGALYAEARRVYSVAGYTSAVLACRKVLMSIAVAQGAEEGEPFIAYVEYLANAGYVPPHGKGWVDHIRRRGNEANHEIALMSRDDAEELISFVEMLLKFIYEFPARVPATP